MTRDDIIRMAKEAGAFFDGDCSVYDMPEHCFERFAALVAAAEREKVAAWMRSKSYATGHGDTVEDLLKELEWQVAEREREACAKVCEGEQFELTQDVAGKNGLQHFDAGCRSCAEMIRARGEK